MDQPILFFVVCLTVALRCAALDCCRFARCNAPCPCSISRKAGSALSRETQLPYDATADDAVPGWWKEESTAWRMDTDHARGDFWLCCKGLRFRKQGSRGLGGIFWGPRDCDGWGFHVLSWKCSRERRTVVVWGVFDVDYTQGRRDPGSLSGSRDQFSSRFVDGVFFGNAECVVCVLRQSHKIIL